MMLYPGDVRAILSKGWSSRMDKDDGPEMEVPPQIYMVCIRRFGRRTLLTTSCALDRQGAP